jgi:hypothetical protein
VSLFYLHVTFHSFTTYNVYVNILNSFAPDLNTLSMIIFAVMISTKCMSLHTSDLIVRDYILVNKITDIRIYE